MLESTAGFMQSTMDKFMLSIMDTSFDREKQKFRIETDDLYFDEDNPIERFLEVYRESKTKSSEVLFKNLSEILKQCPDFPKKSGKVPKDTCAKYIAQKVNTMLSGLDFGSVLSDLDDRYYSQLKDSTVSSWISGKRNIDRLSIFKIAYGLQLPFENENSSVFSCKALFNRVFNQRYCLKQADEFAFSYCLKYNKSYLEALQIILSYKTAEAKITAEKTAKEKTDGITREKDKPISESTKVLFTTAINEKDTKDFIKVLINYIPLFNSETTAVNDELNSLAAVFDDDKILSRFDRKYERIKTSLTIEEVLYSDIEKSRDGLDREQHEKDIETKYPNFYNYVVISDEIFNNAEKQLVLVNHLLLHPEELKEYLKEDEILEENEASLSTEDYYNSPGCPAILEAIVAEGDVTEQLEQIKADLTLLLGIVEPMHFQKLKQENNDKENYQENSNNSDTDNIKLRVMETTSSEEKAADKNNSTASGNPEHKQKKPHSVPQSSFVYFNTKTTSEKSYYENMRKLIITISFFNYFNDYIGETYSKKDFRKISDGFVAEINGILSYYNYNELYVYNSFDLFFILCIHTTDPIYTYYSVIRYYAVKYFILNRPDRELDTFMKKYKIT